MWQLSTFCTVVLVVVIPIGCAPELLVADNADATDTFDSVLSVAADPPETEPGSSENADASLTDDPSAAAVDSARTFSGSVSGSGDYRLFELGPGVPGDEWTVSLGRLGSGPFVVVVFDANQNLLMRTYMSYSRSLQHILRDSTEQVYVGIMPPAGGGGGDFQLEARLATGMSVPAPRQQVVYVNFGGAGGLTVYSRDPISFPPFDGAMIGEDYAGHTQEMKDMILREMHADYARYNVIIRSSDGGPPPDGPHSTVHFGGNAPGLLGLADNVDNYNANLTQDAIVYVENFAPYWTMSLEPDEMAVMIANVASHELGHLLGLYHTSDPDDLMDSTGSAWDLAENQSFIGGPLEPTVFATGWEDTPGLLEVIVGRTADSAKSAAREKSAKELVYKAIRRFTREELRSKCGTCLSLAHE